MLSVRRFLPGTDYGSKVHLGIAYRGGGTIIIGMGCQIGRRFNRQFPGSFPRSDKLQSSLRIGGLTIAGASSWG